MNKSYRRIILFIIYVLPTLAFFILAFSGKVREFDPSGISNIQLFINAVLIGPALISIVGAVLSACMKRAKSQGHIGNMFNDVVIIGFMTGTSLAFTLWLCYSIY